MERAQAEALAERLAREHPDRETHSWLVRRADAGWQVAKVAVPSAALDPHAELRADERPPQAEDPRSAHIRNVGPWVGPG